MFLYAPQTAVVSQSCVIGLFFSKAPFKQGTSLCANIHGECRLDVATNISVKLAAGLR